MSSLKVPFCIAIGLLVLLTTTDGACRQCSATSYAACINETAFYICFDGIVASTQMETCKENMVCTDTQGVCQPNTPEVQLGCPESSKCNECSGTAPLTCVSQTQFAFCNEDGTFGHVAACEKGKVCSLEGFAQSGKICDFDCVTDPTCQNTEPEVPEEGDWKETCDTQTTNGYYINIHDTTCKTYVYCESVNGVMSAVKYECGARYFDVATKKCVDKKPATCT